MKRLILPLIILLILLAAPVVANEMNTYMGIGGVHWVWCGSTSDFNDGRLDVYPIRDWAVRIECNEPLPERTAPPLRQAVYLPIVFTGGNNAQ